MYPSLLCSALLASTVAAYLSARQSGGVSNEETYLAEVCFPNTTTPIIPPCQSIVNIESACLANGTTPLDYLAHAECMCGGSYFRDWLGCLNCDYVHGARSENEVEAFNTILSSASNELCTGTPTATFAAIFSSLSGGIVVTGTQTGMTDQFPSQTAISLYFTENGSQGPGAITGAAASATKSSSSVKSTSSAGTTTGSKTSTTTGTTGSGTTTSSSQSSKSSSAGVAPTGVWKVGLGAVAGGMVMAVL